MDKNEKHTNPDKPKKRRKWPWIVLGVVLLLILIIRISLRTGFVLDFVKNQIESAANEQLEGTLTIGNLRGDLWNHLLITEIRITTGDAVDTDASANAGSNDDPDVKAGTAAHEDSVAIDDTIAGASAGTGALTSDGTGAGEGLLSADTLQIRYSLISLIRGTVQLNEIRLVNPVINLEQYTDSTWNFERLLPPSEEPEEEPGDLPVRIEIDRLDIINGYISMRSPHLLPDTTARMEEIQLQASGALDGENYLAQLHHLTLQLHEGRLDGPVQIETGLTANDHAISLEKLVIATGRTLIEGRGSSTFEGENIQIDVDTRPLSWRDIRAYTDESPLVQDMTMNLQVSGNMEQLRVMLTASATGLENFSLQADMDLRNDPVLTAAELRIDSFDGSLLTDDPEMPATSRVELQASGYFPFASPELADLEFSGQIAAAHVDQYTIDLTGFRGTLDEGRLSAQIDIRTNGQTVSATTNIAALFSDLPDWEGRIEFRNIDPAYWADDPELSGSLTGSITLNGTGFEPSGTPWNFQAALAPGHVAKYEFRSLGIDGYINRNAAVVNLNLDYSDGNILLDANYGWAEEIPGYDFSLIVDRLNLKGLPGFEEIGTSISFELTGEGYGTDPETLIMNASLEFGPSMIDNIRIEELSAPVSISGGFIHIDEAELQSSLAEGQLFVRQHVSDLVHPDNLIEFDLEIGDAELLTNLTDFKRLSARGKITGTYRHVDNLPQIETEVRLRDIRVDTLTASSVRGQLMAVVSDSMPYKINLRIDDPAYGETALRNITIDTDGFMIDNTFAGYLQLELLAEGNSGLLTTTQYYVAPDSVILDVETLTLSDPDRRLDLQKQFRVTYVNDLVKVDSLHLESPDEASLILIFEQFPGDAFKAGFSGRNVNLGHLQNSVLGERIFGGIYDGNIEVDYSNENLFVHIDALLSEFELDGLQLDTISLSIDIADKRLNAELKITDAEEDLIEGHLNAPFIAGDPETFDDSFFQEPVSGSFRLRDTPLSHFSELMNYYDLEGFAGIIGVNAEIDGTAGEPIFEGSLHLYEAKISNVDIDSTLITWDYHHENAYLSFNGFVISRGQQAADITGTIPLQIDMRRLELIEPGDDEEISIQLNTNEFNIAAFNEFLDDQTMTNLRGRLSSDIDISGTMSDPKVVADVRLNNGSVLLSQNNISLSDIRADIGFRDGELTINRIRAESAGSFDLSGTIAFDGFEPGEMELRANARNFRIYNTRDLNALITTDTRLTGDVFKPTISGELRLERGHIYLDNFGERALEDVVLDDEEEESDLFGDIFDAMTIEYKLVIDRRFWVRNRSRPELALELRGELDVVKYPQEDVQLFGTMGTAQGYAQQLGKRFDLERGDIMFSGQANNPELDIRTVYRIRRPEDISIWYEITGTVEDPEFAYSSEPVMELQDIISYTLFGRPLHALQDWERSVAGGAGEGTTAADVAMDVLMDRVELLAADKLGIDVLEIDNSRQGGTSGMTVKAGKYMTDRLFLALMQELGGSANSSFIIEYMINSNLELIFTGSQDYRTGVDVLWRLDY